MDGDKRLNRRYEKMLYGEYGRYITVSREGWIGNTKGKLRVGKGGSMEDIQGILPAQERLVWHLWSQEMDRRGCMGEMDYILLDREGGRM